MFRWTSKFSLISILHYNVTLKQAHVDSTEDVIKIFFFMFNKLDYFNFSSFDLLAKQMKHSSIFYLSLERNTVWCEKTN